MTILSDDIRILKSERLLDTPDGGGRMTGQAVIDGQSNHLFADISSLDRTYGRVSLRKCFVSVLTDNTDSYYGTHAIVADAPDDPRVSVTMFSTQDWTDRRDAAQDRIERYLARGVKWPGQLLERQLTGQRAIALLLKPTDPLPSIGQALVLIQDEGRVSEVEQYVRITRLTTTLREFTVSDVGATVKFTGMVVVCELSDPLRHDFEGPAPSYRDDVSAKAIVRDTVVANAAVYYGIAPTQADAHLGDMRIQVSGLFGQLIPSAQSETPLVDLSPGAPLQPLIACGRPQQGLQATLTAQIAPGKTLFVGMGVLPGSFSLIGSGYTFTDNAGKLYSGSTLIGQIDYVRGQCTFEAGTPSIGGAVQVSYQPAVAPLRVADTAAIAVTPETRTYTYTITLSPPPRPGALMISYMAQGKWYDLKDQGDGSVRGTDSAFGSATVDLVTGSVVLSTGALPDANTAILFAWGTAVSYFNRSDRLLPPVSLSYTVAHPGIVPGTINLSWTDGVHDYEAQDDGHGQLTGDALGTVRYSAGELRILPTKLPLGGTQFTIDYDWGEPQTATFPHPLRNGDGTVTVMLPHQGIRPNTVELSFNLIVQNYDAVSETPAEMQVLVNIDPLKTARDVPQNQSVGTFNQGVAGSIDYVAGRITFMPDTTILIPFARYQVRILGFVQQAGGWKPIYRNTFSHWQYKPAGAMMPLDESALVTVRYRAADSPNHASETFTMTQLNVDLTDRYAERIVPGSLRFTLGNQTYVDRLGRLVTEVQANTGAATLAGSLDYASGIANVTVWQPGATNQLNLSALLTELGGQPVDEVTFRIPGAPVRPGSVQLRATPLTGGQVSATAQNNGQINTAAMLGAVDYQTGVVRVRFGRMVTAAGNESQPWYLPEAVQNGQIFKPLPVFADTIRFNAVAYTYLPLSAEVLGLDPVRLPVDGRVPIFRVGDVVVVHHTDQWVLPNTLHPGDVFDLGRVRLSAAWLQDDAGKMVSASMYQLDLDAGKLTLNANFSSQTLTLPLRIMHRVEDMSLINDAQINGMLSLTRPLTHDYPAPQTRVSSALIIGDLQARAHTLFVQQTWTGEWQDHRIGAGIIAQYNATVYPLGVSNRGAIQERWALIFTNTTEFRVVGESVGQIAMGNTTTLCAPTNPETHVPYFSLHPAGWGAGWAAGNVLRFNTAGANYPIWLARTVLQGPSSQTQDQFQLQLRGDIDR